MFMNNRRTKTIVVVICPYCGAEAVKRLRSKGEIAYWMCPACKYTWKEPAWVGRRQCFLRPVLPII